MVVPARLTDFFEVHYVHNGVKKIVVVEKATMSELDAWICAMLYVYGHNNGFVHNTHLAAVVAHAHGHGISKVRWNKVSKLEDSRPSLFFYGDVMAEGLFIKRPHSTRPLR